MGCKMVLLIAGNTPAAILNDEGEDQSQVTAKSWWYFFFSCTMYHNYRSATIVKENSKLLLIYFGSAMKGYFKERHEEKLGCKKKMQEYIQLLGYSYRLEAGIRTVCAGPIWRCR
jgi:hypothetical protein